MMLGLSSAGYAAYSTTPSNEFFICHGVWCWNTQYSLWNTDKSIVNDIKNYQNQYINILADMIRQTDIYIKAKHDIGNKHGHERNYTNKWFDDPVFIYWDVNVSEQSAKITVDQISKKIGITNKESIKHIKNINLLNMYYSSFSSNPDFKYARSLTTGRIKSLKRYQTTYKDVRVYINTANHRKDKTTFVYKWKNMYYFPVVTCAVKDYNWEVRYDSCEVYWVTKQIINGKIKQISSKYLWEYQEEQWLWEKPVIYFYPTTTTDITAKLDLKWDFSITYPQISKDNTRSIKAQPDGTLTDNKDGKEYSYIFREASNMQPWKIDEWFVVEKKNYVSFLQERLSYLGLTSREYNEFIVYRVPLMNQYPYVALKFAGKDYTDQAPLTITPTPDSIQRVFMVFQWLDKKIDLPPQQLAPFTRSWFAVIEWWGTQIYQ